jgi:catechol 2,3-dioxygenase-like lactoylglutathione lyase family enzyme
MMNDSITGINHITLAVQDIEASYAFYHDILQFKPLCKWHAGAYFLVGDLWFCLNVDKKRVSTACYTHYAFSVSESNFAAIKERIIASKVNIFKEEAIEGKSLYFLDPDGHKIEIHVGDCKSRIEAKKHDAGSWKNVEFYV